MATVLSLLVACTLSFLLLLARLLHGYGEMIDERKFKGHCNRCILNNVVKICVNLFPPSPSFQFYGCFPAITGFAVTQSAYDVNNNYLKGF